jgi:hypothetical protein
LLDYSPPSLNSPSRRVTQTMDASFAALAIRSQAPPTMESAPKQLPDHQQA